jgi:hypothetical protein
MSMILDGTNGVTFNDASLQGAAASPFGLKNRIINGDMRIDQRNAGAAVTASGAFPVDRFTISNGSGGAYSAEQNSSAPVGFINSVKYTTTTANAVTTTQTMQFIQRIEGTNVSDLAWGSANAKTVTLSFWVRSSLTGTFGGALRNSGNGRSYPFTYSISVADTWEYKTVTIPGDTSGTWLTTTGIGIVLVFSLGSGPDASGTAGSWASANYASATGAVSVVGTLNATWYITGVQLEIGTSATPFERRLYNQELANCQRYYITVGGDTYTQTLTMMQAFSTVGFNGGTVPFPVKMRTTPTFSYSALSDFYVQNSAGGALTPITLVQSAGEASTMCGAIKGTVSSGLTAGNASSFLASSVNARLNFSAEL